MKSSRAVARVVWIICGAAFAFSAAAVLLAELNGGEIGSSDTPGSAVIAVSFCVVGAVITSRRPGNPIGLVMLTGGFFNSLNAFAAEYRAFALLTSPGAWPGGAFFSWLYTWAFALGLVAFPLTLLLFPTGRPPSPRWRAVLYLVALAAALMVVPMARAAWPLRGPALASEEAWSVGAVSDLAVSLQQAGIALAVLCMLVAVVSVVLRFGRAEGEECQQIKWLLYAGIFTFVMLATASPAAPIDLPGSTPGILSIAALLALPSIPVAVGIAVLRYHLYDIDLVINRTLVYGALTAALATIYVGGVVVLQEVFRTLTGEKSQLAVVASTLTIAALFSPLRRRIQSFIDRRFYRRKYDAAKTLEAFGAKLRNETDLDSLSGDLVGVVRQTVQPAHASLWLRPAHAAEPRDRAGEG